MKLLKKSDGCIKGIIAIFGIIFLISCGSKVRDLGIYDKSVPPNQQCTLCIDNTLTVTSFDGKKVNWGMEWYNFKNGSNDIDYYSKIQIPAGTHVFIVNYQEFDDLGTIL